MQNNLRLTYSLIAITIIACVVWFITSLSAIFTPFFAALALAYICDPIINYLQQKGLKRNNAIILFFILTLLLAVGVVLVVVPALASQVQALAMQVPNYVNKSIDSLQLLVNNLHDRFKDYFNLKGMVQDSVAELRANYASKTAEIVQTLSSKTGNIFTGLGVVLKLLTAMVLIPIYMFFFLKDMDKVGDSIRNNIPMRYKSKVSKVLAEIDSSLASFFRGRFIIGVIFTVLSTIGYGICGVKYSLLFGILFGIATVIPFLSFFVIVPMTMMVFLDTQAFSPIFWIWFVYAINQALEGFVFTPWILGREVTMHPVTLIMSFLVWGNLFGFLGLLLAVPITASLKIAFRELLAEPYDRLKREL